jgi:hypothetical protein
MNCHLKFVAASLFVCLASLAFAQNSAQLPKLHAYTAVRPARVPPGAFAATAGTLPVWTYNTTSSRDGNNYSGVMVGTSPFDGGNGSTSVRTQVIPLIIKVHRVATGINNDGILSIAPGDVTFDPTVANTACLAAPNNVPLKLFMQSPIVRRTDFNFGGTDVGTAQYVDAFQRANFWTEIGPDYHVKLDPVRVLSPIVVDVPNDRGLSLGIFGSCAPLAIFDINYLDSLLTNTILPGLAAKGVNPSTFPVFLMADAVMSIGNPRNLNQCCVLGYHGATGSGSAIQTYSPMDFESTGLFGPDVTDTSIAAHEVGEWMDDPYGNNPTPAWGHTGQVGGCQDNLEVGDPLTGSNVSPVTMPNGFTYHLQELAFFSWFYGAPSIAVNGWFSNNNTFTSDAGPVCQ